MNDQLEKLSAKVASGLMTRREFVTRAAALGVTAAVANTMLAKPASAAPVAGGTFKMGVQGGESTNTQDPALWASDVPIAIGKLWGETLCDTRPDGSLEPQVASSWSGSADAKTWTFTIRENCLFSNACHVPASTVSESYANVLSTRAFFASISV